MRLNPAMTALALLLAALPCRATVLNFDDLQGDAGLTSYGGLSWSGWRYQSGAQAPYNASTAQTRLYDLSNDNAFGSSAGFTFAGASFSGFATVTLQMFWHGELMASSASLATSATPVFLPSGYAGMLDRVRVVADMPQYFVMDDVTINDGVAVAIPEPGAPWLMLGALAALLPFRSRSAGRPRALPASMRMDHP